MPSYYPYLLSSLPMLSFGMKAPLTIEKLLAQCKGIIPDEDIGTVRLALAPEGPLCAKEKNGTLRRWRSFDTMVRNELVKIRAPRRKIEESKYLRQDGCPESLYAAHIAVNAYRKPSILEAERSLDLERWRELDELSLGHYFDIDALIVYAYKLKILQKWAKIQSADKRRSLEDALAPVSIVRESRAT